MSISQRYVAVQFGLFAIFAAASFLLPMSPASPVKLMGLVAVVVGIGVFVASVVSFHRANRTLPNVIPDPKAQTKLVQTGIYGVVRHPIYTAVLLVTLGIALYHGALGLLALWLLLAVFFWQKSRYEETLLIQKFPEYGAYRRKTGRFWP
jgi:protein-S-isoprenylcysteine O-methyltransferase Ste14